MAKKIITKKINRGPIFETEEEMHAYFESPEGQAHLDKSFIGTRSTPEQALGPIRRKFQAQLEKQRTQDLVEAGFSRSQIKLVQNIYVHRPAYQTV